MKNYSEKTKANWSIDYAQATKEIIDHICKNETKRQKMVKYCQEEECKLNPVEHYLDVSRFTGELAGKIQDLREDYLLVSWKDVAIVLKKISDAILEEGKYEVETSEEGEEE